MSKERRKHERLPVDLLFQYEVTKIPQGCDPDIKKLDTPAIKDISEGGVKIVTQQLLPKGLEIKISIMPLLVPGIMHMEGRVVWNEKNKNGLCSCGIQFIAFEEGSKKIFDNYMIKLHSTKKADIERLCKEAEEMEEF